MSTFDEIARRTLSNPDAQSRLDEARAINEKKLNQASWVNGSRINPNGSTEVARTIASDVPQGVGLLPDVKGTFDFSYNPTFSDRNPVVGKLADVAAHAYNTATNSAASVGGMADYTLSTIGLSVSGNDYKIDPTKSAWENYTDHVGKIFTNSYKTAHDNAKTEEVNTWVQENQSHTNRVNQYRIQSIKDDPNLTDAQKAWELAKYYGRNPARFTEDSATIGAKSVTDMVVGKSIFGGGNVGIFAPIATTTGANFVGDEYKRTGEVDAKTLGYGVGVGAFTGYTSKVLGKYQSTDIDKVGAGSAINKQVPFNFGSQVKSHFLEGGEELIQGSVQQAASNDLQGKSIFDGQLTTGVESALLGTGASATMSAPSTAKALISNTTKQTTDGIKTAYDWGKDRLASDAQKEVNKFSKIYHDNLARMGQEADDNDPKQSMEILSGTLNNLAKQRDDLAEKLKTTTDPKQKKKLQKDYDHATKIYEDISAKHEVVQSEYYKSLSPEELTRLFIEKQRSYQYELAMMGGASIPKAPYTASNSPTPSTVNTGTTNNTKTGTGTTNAVIRMGKYQFSNGKQTNAHDVGRGSGDHIDFHVAGKKGVNPTQYTDRFIVADGKYQGKTLQELLTSKSYVPSSQQAFAAQRKGYKHNGIDFDSRIGGGITINPKYQIKNVTAHHNAGGYGHYVQVHFVDGISIGLGHMGKANVDAFMQAWNNGGNQNNGYGSTQSLGSTGVRHTGIAGITPAKSVSYSNSDGTTTTKVGGSRAWRTNNAGNLIFGSDEAARKVGAIGRDHEGYAIFATEADGDAARM